MDFAGWYARGVTLMGTLNICSCSKERSKMITYVEHLRSFFKRTFYSTYIARQDLCLHTDLLEGKIVRCSECMNKKIGCYSDIWNNMDDKILHEILKQGTSMDKTSIDTSLIHAELTYDNKVWIDMIRKFLVTKRLVAETDKRSILLYYYSSYFQTVEYLLYGDEEKYTMGLYSDLPELI